MKPTMKRNPSSLYFVLGLLAVLPLTGCGVIHAGGDGHDAATAVTVEYRATYVAGYFDTRATFDSITISGSGQDWFVGRLKDSGSWSWVKPSGTAGIDTPMGIDVYTYPDDPETGEPQADALYVAGQQNGEAYIEKYTTAGTLVAATAFEECTEFADVAAGQEVVFAACNHQDGWTGVTVLDTHLQVQDLFIFPDGSGSRAEAQSRRMLLNTRGLYVLGDFRGKIELTRLVDIGSDPRLIYSASGQDVFVARFDAVEAATGSLLAKSGRGIGSEGEVEAADFALGEGDIFVGVRNQTDLTLDNGRPTESVCPGAGTGFNFTVIRLDGGLVPGATDPLLEDGINAPLSVDWAVPRGSCEDGVLLEALDHSAFDLLLAGTFGGTFPTDTETLTTHGGQDAFAMYLDSADGREKAAFSGGGEGDEQVFDNAKGGLALSWVAGSYVGDVPTFPIVLYDQETILKGSEEILPGASRDEVMVWRMPF